MDDKLQPGAEWPAELGVWSVGPCAGNWHRVGTEPGMTGWFGWCQEGIRQVRKPQNLARNDVGGYGRVRPIAHSKTVVCSRGSHRCRPPSIVIRLRLRFLYPIWKLERIKGTPQTTIADESTGPVRRKQHLAQWTGRPASNAEAKISCRMRKGRIGDGLRRGGPFCGGDARQRGLAHPAAHA